MIKHQAVHKATLLQTNSNFDHAELALSSTRLSLKMLKHSTNVILFLCMSTVFLSISLCEYFATENDFFKIRVFYWFEMIYYKIGNFCNFISLVENGKIMHAAPRS